MSSGDVGRAGAAITIPCDEKVLGVAAVKGDEGRGSGCGGWGGGEDGCVVGDWGGGGLCDGEGG